MDNEWDNACVMLVKLGITFNSLHEFTACLWTHPKSLYSNTHFVVIPLRRGIAFHYKGEKKKTTRYLLITLVNNIT